MHSNVGYVTMLIRNSPPPPRVTNVSRTTYVLLVNIDCNSLCSLHHIYPPIPNRLQIVDIAREIQKEHAQCVTSPHKFSYYKRTPVSKESSWSIFWIVRWLSIKKIQVLWHGGQKHKFFFTASIEYVDSKNQHLQKIWPCMSKVFTRKGPHTPYRSLKWS